MGTPSSACRAGGDTFSLFNGVAASSTAWPAVNGRDCSIAIQTSSNSLLNGENLGTSDTLFEYETIGQVPFFIRPSPVLRSVLEKYESTHPLDTPALIRPSPVLRSVLDKYESTHPLETPAENTTRVVEQEHRRTNNRHEPLDGQRSGGSMLHGNG